MASYSLRAYALGLLGFMLIKILAPGYFSRQDMKTPVRFGIIAMAANMGLNVLLVAPLYFWFNIGHVGLALATSLSAYLNVWLLYRGLRQVGVYRPQPGWRRLFAQYALANAAMMAVLLVALSYWADWSTPLWWQRCARLAILCLGGLLVYALVLRLVGIKIRHFRGMHG